VREATEVWGYTGRAYLRGRRIGTILYSSNAVTNKSVSELRGNTTEATEVCGREG
jgi:hypothetical protein